MCEAPFSLQYTNCDYDDDDNIQMINLRRTEKKGKYWNEKKITTTRRFMKCIGVVFAGKLGHTFFFFIITLPVSDDAAATVIAASSSWRSSCIAAPVILVVAVVLSQFMPMPASLVRTWVEC